MNTETEKQLRAHIAGLEKENERLLLLEKSIFIKARNIKGGGWKLSDEDGAAGEIHAAITGLLIEMEGEVSARQALEEKLASR